MFPIESQKLINKAEEIGKSLIKNSVIANDNSITWNRGADKYRQPILDSGFFNGRCGEALFFASLYTVTHKIEYYNLSLNILSTLCRNFEDDNYINHLLSHLWLGINGLGGIIYSLIHTGKLLREPKLISIAFKLASRVTPELLSNDYKYDVIWGTAGVLMAIIAVAKAGNKVVLKNAEYCAQHLLKNRTIDKKTGIYVWSTLQETPNTGFAHGSAGIGQAFIKLYEYTSKSIYYNTAMDAFRFERHLFRQHLMNWPDRREQLDKEVVMCSWCHGATGIGLSRFSSFNVLKEKDENEISLDIKNALLGTLKYDKPTVDTLCCGYFGHIALLFEAGFKLNNKSIQKKMWELVHSRIKFSNEKGFILSNNDNEIEPHFRGGFLQGLTGIGYMLVHLTNPPKFPFVLSLS